MDLQDDELECILAQRIRIVPYVVRDIDRELIFGGYEKPEADITLQVRGDIMEVCRKAGVNFFD